MNGFAKRFFNLILLLSTIAGFILPQFGEISGVLILIILAIIIFASSFKVDFSPAFFKTQAKVIIAFYLLRFLLLPVLVFFIVHPFSSFYASSLFLLMLLPAGVTAPAFTNVFHGNVTLALAMLMVSSFLAPFVFPALSSALMTEVLKVDQFQLFATLFATVILPYLVHIPFRKKRGINSWMMENDSFVSIMGIAFIFALAIAEYRPVLLAQAEKVLPYFAVSIVAFFFLYLFGWIALISRAQHLLQTRWQTLVKQASAAILASIAADLTHFKVHFKRWFHESSLNADELEQMLTTLSNAGLTEQREQALWLKTTQFGDEKDRVLVRANQTPTYFAFDGLYHQKVFQENYARVITLWGADHHGYVARMQALLQGLQEDVSKYQVLLIQFASLYAGKEKLSMSTRTGSFVTLAELVAEVGVDAARYFYLARRSEQHLDFDIELAKSQTAKNPVYYIQYAHARISRIFTLLEPEQAYTACDAATLAKELNQPLELELIAQLSEFPLLLQTAAERLEVYTIPHYLYELAKLLHSYYNQTQIRVNANQTRNARLGLLKAVQQVLANGLTLLDLNAPAVM